MRWLLIAAVSGCGVEAVQGDEVSTDARGLTAPTTELQFNFDWTVRAGGPLVQGAKATLLYQTARVQECTGDFNGQPAWVVTAHSVLGDGPEKTEIVGGLGATLTPKIIDLDRTGVLKIWFEVTNRWGCRWFDSNFGQNYVFDVVSGAGVRFNQDWSTTVEGTLGQSGAMIVEYALERLPLCRAWYRGFAAWGVVAYARFDGGPLLSAPVMRREGQDLVAAPAAFAIPPGAKEVELWFFNSDIGGCQQYDSNWGQNYHLSVATP